MHHFILTRFNLTLWHYEKNGKIIDRGKWLEERLQLFETYCLPSMMGQSCKNFVWILLLDENTPEKYRKRIGAYRDVCPNIKFVYVKDGYGFRFAEVFQGVIAEILEERKNERRDVVVEDEFCLTTYLDNDDCLNCQYVEIIQNIAKQNAPKYDKDYFITFDYGLQYFTDIKMATRVLYPNNHFMTLVERAGEIKTCYGYGSHYFLENNKDVSICCVPSKERPMWIEVIHKNNVDNDVKMTFDTKILDKGGEYLKSEFNIDASIKFDLLSFLIKYIKQMYRRGRDKFIPRKW